MHDLFKIFRVVLTLALSFLLLGSPAEAQEKVWKVLYVEGGPFSNYQNTLAHTARGLEKLGLLSNAQVEVPKDKESSREMWDWLAQNATGRLQFLPDGHYTASWDAASRITVKNEILKRIRERRCGHGHRHGNVERP